MHNVIPGAKAYISVLHARLIQLGGLIFTKSPIVDLIREDERVAGVIAEIEGVPTRFYARNGVVLAAGDYTNSEALIARFKGSRYAHIEGINERSLGDGHILAEKSGAKLVNMDVTYGPELRFIAPRKKTFQQLLPARGPLSKLMGLIVPYMPQAIMNIMIRRLLVTWQHPENSLFDHGAILVNANGERFCDETTWPEREIAIAKQPGKICYILLDGRLIEQYSAWPNFISTAPKIGYAYTQDYLRLRPDVCVQTNTLDDLAATRQIPLKALEASVATANQKRMELDGLPRLETGPWMLLGPAKAYFTTTEGGVLINKQLQALDASLNPIPGLYAVGQNGLGGQILWGHGLHICWAITSGRLAGKLLISAESNW
jgi:fumarate reductase flavoprotein subunit